jgi:membrane complex biogenesis BtpA family protein
MERQGFKDVFGPDKVGIGVIHLAPLPGSPAHVSDLDSITAKAVEEANIIEKAGFGGLIVENYGDIPFHRDDVGPETIASMALIVKAVRDAVDLPIGINVLRNDAHAALAVAGVCRAEFVRVNVLVGAFVTSEGIIEGRPAEVLRLRDALAPESLVLADIMVKHGSPLAATTISEEALDAAERGRADCVIVTGTRTGLPPSAGELTEARNALAGGTRQVPILAGSGAVPSNLESLMELSDGVIVGSYMRRGGVAGADLETDRVIEIGGMLKQYVGKAGR